jgi:FkbH-like protein
VSKVGFEEQSAQRMKLLEALQIVRAPRFKTGRKLAVSVVSGFNPLHLITFLDAELRLRHVDRSPTISSGLYGDFWGNLERARAGDDAVIVFLEWADFDPRLGIRSFGSWAPSALPSLRESAQSRAALLEMLLSAIAKESQVAICFPTLPLPPVAFTPGWRASELELELRTLISSVASRCAQIENVRVLSPQRVDQLSPFADRIDVRSEMMTGFPYHLTHASILAEQLIRLLGDEAPKKALITDLDGTLWREILGEVGPECVSWDLDHRSLMHGVYQQFLQSLAQAGVLIAVASKNNPALVSKVFRRKDMILDPESVFPMEVHWGAKSESVARILKDWNIGADAVVFVDDSPAELGEVRSIYPQVECVQFPTDQPQAMYQLLYHLRDLFGKSVVTDDDRVRSQSIRRAQELRANREMPTGSSESLLRQAEAELTFNFAKEPLPPRAFELINKTNQFNLNGRRYTAAEWQKHLLRPEVFLLLVSYRDKYGPLGVIAVLAGRQQGSSLWIDNWVMSCRAFGRRIEYKCLEVLLDRFEASEVTFDFLPTERNGPVQTFLEGICGPSPVPGCTLRRGEFMARCPETFHAVTEMSHG